MSIIFYSVDFQHRKDSVFEHLRTNSLFILFGKKQHVTAYLINEYIYILQSGYVPLPSRNVPHFGENERVKLEITGH